MAFTPVAPLALVASLAALMVPCDASVWQATQEDVETSLIGELAGLVRTGQQHRLQAVLRPIYDALPKNSHGNLEPEAVRSALRRLFLQQPGWSLKGLEPGDEASAPARLQRLLEGRAGGRGLGAGELAALAASLEDLTHKESMVRLKQSYQAVGLPFTAQGDRAQVLRALRGFAEAYIGDTTAAKEWLLNLDANQWQAGESPDGKMSFQDAGRAARAIERQFSRFKSQECTSLKSTDATSHCLDVSSLYALCCRSTEEYLALDAQEPSIWVEAWREFPRLWIFSAVCFFLSALVTAGRWLCGCPPAGGAAGAGEAASEAAPKPEEAAEGGEAEVQGATARQPGLLGSCLALCLLCAAAVAADLLDAAVAAPALAAGLALLAAGRFVPTQAAKAKKI